MNVALWERYFYVVLVQRLINAGHDVAHGIRFLDGINPYYELHVDAAVTKLREYHFYGFSPVRPFVAKLGDGILYELGSLLQVGTIGHTERYCCQYVAVIARQVLVVLAE